MSGFPVRKTLFECAVEIFLHDHIIDPVRVRFQFALVIQVLEDRIAVTESAAPQNALDIPLFIGHSKWQADCSLQLFQPVKRGKVFFNQRLQMLVLRLRVQRTEQFNGRESSLAHFDPMQIGHFSLFHIHDFPGLSNHMLCPRSRTRGTAERNAFP